MFTLLKLKRRFDVVVVMLYAPWCCHSQSFAPQFAETAEVFSDTRNVSQRKGLLLNEGWYIQPLLWVGLGRS